MKEDKHREVENTKFVPRKKLIINFANHKLSKECDKNKLKYVALINNIEYLSCALHWALHDMLSEHFEIFSPPSVYGWMYSAQDKLKFLWLIYVGELKDIRETFHTDACKVVIAETLLSDLKDIQAEVHDHSERD